MTSASSDDPIPGIPDRNWTVFRWNNLQAYHNA
jgi:hypothetical protein